MADRLMLLDTASLYFRAFHALPEKLKAPDGTPVNAVRGLLDMIARLVTDFEPTHLVACWDDAWRPAWRVKLVPTYKAHRLAEAAGDGANIEDTPPGLDPQVPLIREVLTALNLPVVGAADHEADDVIGSFVAQAKLPVDVVTGDRDLFQLVDDERDVRIIYTARGMSKLELVREATVVDKYGVLPSQYVDFATLRGDPSDGLPGVAGIGEKTAANLLLKFGALTGILAAAGEKSTAMSAAVRAKLAAAGDYLDAAPKAVAVVRTLDVGAAARLQPLRPEQLNRAEELAATWNLGGSAVRALRALGNDPTAG